MVSIRRDVGPVHARLGLSPVGLSLFAAGYLTSVVVSERLYGTLAVPSPFWLPDSVLLCALLLTRRDAWRTLLAAALVIRLVAGAVPGTPTSFMYLAIAVDLAKGVAAAWGLQRIIGPTVRLSTQRELVAFFGIAATAVPFVSAILIALARQALGDPFWPVALGWFMGDAVAQVVVTPALLYWCLGHYRRPAGRPVEWVLVLLGLLGVLYVVFVAPAGATSPLLVYAPVPFLVWAAVRLCPFSTANAIVLLAGASMFAAVNDSNGFLGGSPEQTVLSLQLFLLVIAIPVLSLAVVTSQRESESHDLQVILDTAPVAILTTREHAGRQVMANQAAYALYMVPAGANLSVDGSGNEQPFRLTSQGSVIPPDQLPLRRASASGLPVTGQPLTLERADGTQRYLIGNALPLRDEDGSIRGAVGAFQDVTDMRLAEVALRESEARLRELTRRLISEQEQARAGFARDLHDDVGQRLTLVQLGLERFVQSSEGLSLEAHRRLSAILRSAEQIASDIQKMSHRLHPSTLDALGLVSALRSASREFGEKSQLRVSFSHEGPLRDIPPDVCLGLFRVAQEALTNVVKHSGVAEATLRLSGHRDRITLYVCDEGIGFDPRRVESAPLSGLGLVSMRERLNLIGGELHVRSAPSQGSEVRAIVSLHRIAGAGHRG